MKRLALVSLILALAGAATLLAQEPAEKKAEHKVSTDAKEGEGEHKAEEDFTMWKWGNFGLLAIGLGYMIGKGAPKFFKDRTDSIQKDMADSAKVAADAEARAKAVELKISKLTEELERMRSEARTDMARESERLQNDTARSIERVSQRAEQEVESAAKVARLELKQYAAQLAVDLAEQRIRTRLNSDTQGKLIDSFVQDLGKN